MKIQDINQIDIKTIEQELNDFKILHLSDLHINKKTTINDVKNLVDTCNKLDFDVAVITGDIIDCKVKFIIEQVKVLEQIKGKVFYISGNHDLFYGLKDLNKILKNIEFLDNRINFIPYNESKIYFAGISDRFSKFFKHKRDEEYVLNELKSKKLKILLAHQPKDYKLAVKSNSNLFLCGHTHGGQIWPFHYFVRIVQPFLNGLHYINNCALYINKGIGTWGVDIRYKANSEIALLRFVNENSNNWRWWKNH